MQQRITVRYEGRVQGVGFRFTVASLAEERDVNGWVKNEFDRSVLLVAEGEENQLMGFVNAIRSSHLGRHITNEFISQSAADGSLEGFSVRY